MTAARLLIGDVFDRMAELPDHSVDLILTSPPFLALRSYLPDGHPDKHKEIGSEATPAEYLDTLLALTAVWRRLLAPHGSIAVELGDTYAGSGGAGGDYNDGGLRDGQERFNGSAAKARAHATKERTRNPGPDLPLDKSLLGIPTLYTWSLAYGRNLLTGQPSPAGMWRIRNLKPWIRSNPPVGALGDKERPATSYITVATLSRDRWFDLDAVRTAVAHPNAARPTDPKSEANPNSRRGTIKPYTADMSAGAPPLDWYVDVDAVIDAEIDRRAGKTGQGGGPGPARAGKIHGGVEGGAVIDKAATTVGARGVHIRRALERAGILTTHDALDVSPRGYPGQHYATWPMELCRLLIDEMCPRHVCTTCGQPRRRIVEQTEAYAEFRRQMNAGAIAKGGYATEAGHGDGFTSGVEGRDPNGVALGSPGAVHRSGDKYRTVGWSDCGHNTWRPGHILDPFGGSGTTGAVATGMGRDCTLIDLDERNAHLARERIGMFLEVTEAPKGAA